MNLNDTIFMFLCTLLVWLMTPGLSLFYGGLVQSKNALNTVMQSMAAIVLVTFVWITVGFTISFGEGNLWFGNWEYTFLNHVGFATQEDISPHIPLALFMLFQMMFCTIAISILSGSIAEKMKFIPYLLFVVIWTALVYSPVWIHRNLVTTVFIGFGVPNGSLNYILSKISVVFLSSSLNFSSNK